MLGEIKLYGVIMLQMIGEKIFCSTCRRKTNHSILEANGNPLIVCEELPNRNDNNLKTNSFYSIAKCNGCDKITFVRKCTYEYMDNQEKKVKSFYQVYPDPLERMDQLEHVSFKNLPDNIFMLTTEVHVAYISKLNLLCAAGLRVIVEAICLDKGISGRNLYEKIEGLLSKKIISDTQCNVLHKIRSLGNETVHEINFHNDKLILEGVNVINSILFNVYGFESCILIE
jgi:hypothetical protein